MALTKPQDNPSWKSSRVPGKINDNEHGQRLKFFRKTLDKTQPDLAVELNISIAMVSKYENGTHYIPNEVPRYLHKKYDMNYSWFFDGVGKITVNATEKKSMLVDINSLQDIQMMQSAKITSMEKTLYRLLQENQQLTLRLNELESKSHHKA